MLLFRNGLVTLINPPYAPAPMWLIGVSNSFVFWLYPTMVFLTVDYYINHNKCSLIPVLLASIMNIFSDSTTGLVGSVIFLAIVFFPKLRYIITPIRLGVLGIVLFVFVVILGSSSFLEPIVVQLLGKDMTFSSRTIVWANALEAIVGRPIFGYGALPPSQVSVLLGRMSNGLIGTAAIHCHSQYLQLFFRYGIFGSIIFTLLYIIEPNIPYIKNNLRYCE